MDLVLLMSRVFVQQPTNHFLCQYIYMAIYMALIHNRDRKEPRGSPPPTPPYHGGSVDYSSSCETSRVFSRFNTPYNLLIQDERPRLSVGLTYTVRMPTSSLKPFGPSSSESSALCGSFPITHKRDFLDYYALC
jgi:hypothetical protein